MEWYVGMKPYDHDSGFIAINPIKKELFGFLLERHSRIKHDQGLCLPLLDKIPSQSKVYFSFNWLDYQLPLSPAMDSEAIRKIVGNPKTPKKEKIIQSFRKSPKRTIGIIKDRMVYGLMRKMNKNGLEYARKRIFKQNFSFIYGGSFDHHLCHAVSSYYLYDYKKKRVCLITFDGKGDGFFSKVFIAQDDGIVEVARSHDVYSIGELYSDFTEVLGLVRNSDEGKIEALACYGKPNKKLLSLLEKSYMIDDSLSISIKKSAPLWIQEPGSKRCKRNLEIWKDRIGDKNFAAVIQEFLERIGVLYIKKIQNKYDINAFGFSGGIFANVKLSLKIFEECKPAEMFIAPPMGDDGTILGAAILGAMREGHDVTWLRKKTMPYWGPRYTRQNIEKALRNDSRIRYEDHGTNWEKIAATMISKGKIIAVFQDRMEFGPRALGNRSVLADPRGEKSRKRINSTIKRRPWYQPFCPSALAVERGRLFEKSYDNKHMSCAFRMKKKYHKKLSSAMHVDGTARPQFVAKEDNPSYYKLIKEFKKHSGFGIIINTSFNLHGRAMVMSPEHAIQDFIDCGIDALFIEGYLVRKNEK